MLKEFDYVYKCKNHGYLKIDEVIKCTEKSASRGFRYRCKICYREYRINRYYGNRQENIKKAGIWKKENRERINKQVRIDRIENPEKYKKWYETYRKKHGEILNHESIARTKGITINEYYQMFINQDNKCAICNYEETRKFKGKTMNLCVDHCHKTGNVRQLLCHACNTGIGKFKEDKNLLLSAIDYLKKHEET